MSRLTFTKALLMGARAGVVVAVVPSVTSAAASKPSTRSSSVSPSPGRAHLTGTRTFGGSERGRIRVLWGRRLRRHSWYSPCAELPVP